jgi:hypothetical protein
MSAESARRQSSGDIGRVSDSGSARRRLRMSAIMQREIGRRPSERQPVPEARRSERGPGMVGSIAERRET